MGRIKDLGNIIFIENLPNVAKIGKYSLNLKFDWLLLVFIHVPDCLTKGHILQKQKKYLASSGKKKVAQRHGSKSQTSMTLTMFVAYTISPDSATHVVTKKMSLQYN